MPVELPFGTRSYFPQLNPNDETPLFAPQLVADNAGFIHAFWLGEDAEILHSSVPAGSFADFNSWELPVILGQNVVKFEVLVGENGRLNLAYITNIDTPDASAGLYYRRSDDGTETWSEPVQLYQSSYFRLLTPDNAHLMISQDSSDLYISWDNRPRERVYLIHSQNGGSVWGPAEEIDRRQENDNSDNISPRNILVANNDGIVHLTWQAGHEGVVCTQIHQWSNDEGATWQTSINYLDTIQNCPSNVQFLNSDAGLFLMVATPEVKNLLLWAESQWSDPLLQPELTTSIDEEVFRSVNYTCGQTLSVTGDRLLAVSCGQGAGQDIWFTSRSLTSLVESTQATNIWSAAAELDAEAVSISSPSLLADGENDLHLFWTQVNESEIGSAIYYSIWDGLNWSRSINILTSPNGEAFQPSVALSPFGNFLAVWSDGTVGEIYFSRVGTGQALISSAWSDPIPLPTVRSAASAPSITVDKDGNFHVVYAIPLNENRGIYIVNSEDRGATWSDPTLVFDAVASEWDMVDQPKLYLAEDGSRHLLFLRQPLTGGIRNGALLYYSRSQNGEIGWSEPEQVHSPSQQTASIVWQQIVGQGERVVHRSWQEQMNGRTGLWHQISIDNGLTWNQPARLHEVDNPGSAQMTIDMSGQAYMVSAQTELNINDNLYGVLEQWVWQGDHWQIEEGLELPGLPVLRASNLASAATGDGRLAVVYTGQSEDEIVPELLSFTNRALPVSDVAPTPLPTLTPTPEPTGTPTPIATPEPTPEIVFPVDSGSGPPTIPILGTLSGNNILIVGAILAIIPVGLVIVLVLLRRARSNPY